LNKPSYYSNTKQRDLLLFEAPLAHALRERVFSGIARVSSSSASQRGWI